MNVVPEPQWKDLEADASAETLMSFEELEANYDRAERTSNEIDVLEQAIEPLIRRRDELLIDHNELVDRINRTSIQRLKSVEVGETVAAFVDDSWGGHVVKGTLIERWRAHVAIDVSGHEIVVDSEHESRIVWPRFKREFSTDTSDVPF